MIKYSNALTDWENREMPLQQFLREQQSMWGQPHFNRCETLLADDIVRVYTDRDQYLDHQPTQAEYEQEFKQCHDHMVALFEGDPNFSPSQIHIAHRHGLVPDKGWKVSFRCYVTGYKIRMQDIPKLLKAAGQEDFWDLAPYSARQHLAVPGGCKGLRGDHRVLELGDHSDAIHCIAQALVGGEQLLGGFDEEVKDNKRYKTEAPPEWTQVETTLHEAGFSNPRFRGRRESSLTFTCDQRGQQCPCQCGNVHDSQNW